MLLYIYIYIGTFLKHKRRFYENFIFWGKVIHELKSGLSHNYFSLYVVIDRERMILLSTFTPLSLFYLPLSPTIPLFSPYFTTLIPYFPPLLSRERATKVALFIVFVPSIPYKISLNPLKLRILTWPKGGPTFS